MTEFWKEIIETLLGDILYHGEHPDEKTWCAAYEYETQNIVDDIKDFHEVITNTGITVTDEVLADFFGLS